MIITNPAVLWLAALIPAIVFAYFIRRRIRERSVPALFLWEDVLKSSLSPVKGFRARNWLSMLVAILIACLILMSAARPSWRSAGSEAPLIVVLDDSASMAARDRSGKTRFELARKALRDLVDAKSDARDVMLLTVSGAPEVRQGFTRDFAALRSAVDAIVQGDGSCAMRETFEQALEFRNARGEDASILILSGGAFEGSEELLEQIANDDRARLQIVGEPLGNIALLDFATRRAPDGSAAIESLIDVANYSESPANVNVEIELNGDLLDILPLELQPGERARQVVRNESTAGGSLRAKLALQDEGTENALESDDEIVAELAPFPPVRILLCGTYDRFVETALRAQPNAELVVVDQAPETLEPNDFLVLCGDVPDVLPKGKVAIISPAKSCELFEIGDETGETFADDVIDSGLTRYVRLDRYPLRGVRALEIADPADAVVFARTPEAPVVFAIYPEGDKENARFVLNFSTEGNVIGLQTLFPVLYANLTGAARSVEEEDRSAFKTPVPEESDLRSEALAAYRTETQADAPLREAQTPLWFLLGAAAFALAVAEFYLWSRRKLE